MSEYTTYGCTRTFGSSTYSVSGCSSREEAVENVHQRAFENGDWHPPMLREKWWQLWRPRGHTELEAKFASRTTSNGGGDAPE